VKGVIGTKGNSFCSGNFVKEDWLCPNYSEIENIS
jgi:hypothetical protein